MEIEAFPFVYGMKSLYIIMGSVLWCSLWPYLLSSHVQGILQGLLGRKHIKTLGLNAHMRSFPLKMLYHVWIYAWNHRVKKYVNVLSPVITKWRLKFACSELQSHLSKAKGTGRGGRSWWWQRYCCTAARGELRAFCVTMCLQAPCFCLWCDGWL